MLQEKTPLQRKTRSESAGEGRKAGGRGAAAGRGEEGDSGVAVGLVGGEERERAHVYFGGAVAVRKRIAPFSPSFVEIKLLGIGLGIGSMTWEFWSGAISGYST